MRKLPTGVKTCFYSDRGAHSHTQGFPRVNCAPASGVPHPDLAAAPSTPTQRPSTPSTHTCNGAAPSQAPRSGSEAAPSRTSRHQTADRESCARAVATRKLKLQKLAWPPYLIRMFKNASGWSCAAQRIQSPSFRGIASPFTAGLAASNASGHRLHTWTPNRQLATRSATGHPKSKPCTVAPTETQ